MSNFNWEEAEYPCFGIADNGKIVCFSSYEVGQNIETLNCDDDWYMQAFKPYTPPKPKTKLWYWEVSNNKGDWFLNTSRYSEEDAKEIFEYGYRKLEALGYIEED